MARAGLSKEQLTKGGGLNFGTGNGEVVNAVCLVHQFPPNKTTGDQEEERCKIRLTIQRMDKDWKAIDDEEPLDEYIAVAGKGGLAKFHPGNASGPDDEDPDDLGDVLETEGNCIYAVDGAGVNQNSKLGLLTTALQDNGFKPEYLNGYMPNLIGLQAHFITKKMKSDDPNMKDWDVLLVDKIQRFPYQKGGVKAAAPAAGKAAAGKAAVSAKGKAKPAAVEAEEVAAESDASSEALRVLTELGVQKAGKQMTRSKTEGLPADRIPGKVMSIMGKLKVPPAMYKEVKDLIADDDFFNSAAEDLNWTIDGETVDFPEL